MGVIEVAQVTLRNVKKAFGTTVVVHELNLVIRDGEFLTLLGPSGCGKTTTLRMIAGLENPSAGEILFDDRVVTDLSPMDRNVAMVFQSYALYPHMTVRQNLEYPLKKRRVAAEERRQSVLRIAELLQLEELLDRRPRQLSGGQQQRVALGRALIRGPEVFLLDEPLSNLDAKLRGQMRTEISEIHLRTSKTMIYVTHDQLEAMTMSDRIAIMNKGRIAQIGTPDEIYNWPSDIFVAGFVGTPAMNFIHGELQTRDMRDFFVSKSVTAMLPPEWGVDRSGVRTDGKVVLGIRPEDILLGQDGNEAAVSNVEPLGHETLVHLSFDGHQAIARAHASIKLRPGEVAKFGIQAGQMHLFDAESGKTLRSRARGA